MAGHMSHKYKNSAYSKTIDDNDEQSNRGEGLEGVYESVSDKQETDGSDHAYAVPSRRRQDKEWHDILHTGSHAKTSQLDDHIEKPNSTAACSGKSHFLTGALIFLVIGLTAVVGYLMNEQVNLTSKIENHFKETSESFHSYQEKLKDCTVAERLNMTLTTLGSNYKEGLESVNRSMTSSMYLLHQALIEQNRSLNIEGFREDIEAVVAAVALLNQTTQDSVTRLNQTINIEASVQDLTHKQLLNTSLSLVEQNCDSKLSISQQSTTSEISFVNRSVSALEQSLSSDISTINSTMAGLVQRLSILEDITPTLNCRKCTSSIPCPISTLFLAKEDCQSGFITTDGYPNNYAHYIDKKWALINQRYTTLTLTLLEFELELHSKCGFDFLQVNQEAKLCGTESANTTVRYDVRNAQVVTMYFHTDGSITDRGFKLSFSFS